MTSTALVRIPVGVVVERHEARSSWLDFVCRPVSVLAGVPAAAPWTVIRSEGDVTAFYAGEAVIELHRTETANYRSNLASGAPALWVILRPSPSERPCELIAVTADPAEGEAFTDAGSNLVETVPMPPDVVAASAETDRSGGNDRARKFRRSVGAIEAQRKPPRPDGGVEGYANPLDVGCVYRSWSFAASK